MNSDFRSASEQVGLKAGDGGFQLDIARNTTLVGAAISSSERAALEGRNALGTGTLDVREVKNTAPPPPSVRRLHYSLADNEASTSGFAQSGVSRISASEVG